MSKTEAVIWFALEHQQAPSIRWRGGVSHTKKMNEGVPRREKRPEDMVPGGGGAGDKSAVPQDKQRAGKDSMGIIIILRYLY